MIYTAPDGIHVLDMATRQTKLLVANPPRDPNGSARRSRRRRPRAGRRAQDQQRLLHQDRRRHGANAVYKADTNTGAVRKLVDLPPHVSIVQRQRR
jgi:oligogalacturonide lyase